MQALKKELSLLVPSLKVFLVSGIGRGVNTNLRHVLFQQQNRTGCRESEFDC
jgi:hypothetical protein